MILTDRQSVITEEIGLPPVIQRHSSTPQLVYERDQHVVQEAPEVAPLILEIATSNAVMVTNEAVSQVAVAAVGPQGIQGDKGDPASNIAAVTFSGGDMIFEFDDGTTATVPFSLDVVDGGTF